VYSPHYLVAHKLTKPDRETGPKKFRELIREIAACSSTGTQDLVTVPANVDADG
jgi:hypothetical protein